MQGQGEVALNSIIDHTHFQCDFSFLCIPHVHTSYQSHMQSKSMGLQLWCKLTADASADVYAGFPSGENAITTASFVSIDHSAAFLYDHLVRILKSLL